MPLPFRRRDRISPDFIAAPAEPALAVPDEVRIADLDTKLIVLARTVNRAPGLCDRILDLRNAIRPARPRPVPVIPGRS